MNTGSNAASRHPGSGARRRFDGNTGCIATMARANCEVNGYERWVSHRTGQTRHVPLPDVSLQSQLSTAQPRGVVPSGADWHSCSTATC